MRRAAVKMHNQHPYPYPHNGAGAAYPSAPQSHPSYDSGYARSQAQQYVEGAYYAPNYSAVDIDRQDGVARHRPVDAVSGRKLSSQMKAGQPIQEACRQTQSPEDWTE